MNDSNWGLNSTFIWKWQLVWGRIQKWDLGEGRITAVVCLVSWNISVLHETVVGDLLRVRLLMAPNLVWHGSTPHPTPTIISTFPTGQNGPEHLKLMRLFAGETGSSFLTHLLDPCLLVPATLLFWAVSELYCWAAWIGAIKNIWGKNVLCCFFLLPK